jgi:hypothetical protein
MRRIALAMLLVAGITMVAVCGDLELWRSQRFHILDNQLMRAALLTSDGYYILAGDGDMRSAAVLVRATFDCKYPLVWSRVYTDTFARMFSDVIELADGGIVAGGTAFYSIYAGDENAWLVKVDRQGDTIWEKQYGRTSEQNDVYAMAASSDGGFVVCVLRLPHAGGSAMTWLLKLDTDGNLIWEKTFANGVGLSVIEVSSGGYLISGLQGVPQSFNSYVWVLRVDSQGNPIWEKTYTDLEIYVQLSNQVVEAPNGDFVIAGKQFLRRIDPTGGVVWTRSLPGLFLDAVAFTDNGKLAIGGAFNDNCTYDHLYVALLSDDGATTYWEDIEVLFNSSAASVLPDPYDGVAVAGWVQTRFGSGPTDPGTFDFVLARFLE